MNKAWELFITLLGQCSLEVRLLGLNGLVCHWGYAQLQK